MQISKDTMAKLKNFASINPNLVYDGNGKLKTISEAKNILASADVDIDKPLSIYDVNEFLSIVGLIEDGDITINENECVISNRKSKVRYVFADPNILTSPQKDITMPPYLSPPLVIARQISALSACADRASGPASPRAEIAHRCSQCATCLGTLAACIRPNGNEQSQ